MKRAIREHLTDFLAIGALLIFGLAVAGYVLSQQQQPYPSWIPFLGDERFELKAELSTAQAVTPGQGQTVNISGVKAGDISEVELDEGVAVVTMLIEPQYAALIHTDATVLLRPRTGLQDMTMELNPGRDGPAIEEGATIPLSQTEPNVNPDQILASLDADTRAYLQLLVQAGGEGLGGRGKEFSAGLRRFEPLGRDLAKINVELAERRENIARSITNFGALAEVLARSDVQLTEFVTAQSEALGGFADEADAIEESLRELPSTLQTTQEALESADEFAIVSGQAAEELIPAAQSFAPAQVELQRFLTKTVGPIENQIRPFTRVAQKPIRHLKQAADPLAKTAKGTAKSLSEINNLFNAWAYNPPGSEEGYLFWTAWLNHNANNAALIQDATSPLPRAVVLQSCATARLAEQLAVSRPFIKTLQQYTNAPLTEIICPLDPSDTGGFGGFKVEPLLENGTGDGTRPPTTTRILVAVGFALSCFGLALFLWLAFGGPIPLKPEGYRVNIPFTEATQLAVESDVRISGVSVGKVKAVELGDTGYADATIELDAPYAPIPEDTRAILRQKTLLGETYVELTPGSNEAPSLPEGGSLPAAQVADSVQLDEIFRTFDPRTRAAFQAWMQGAAAAFRGRGQDFSLTIASLDPFAQEAERLLRLLDSQDVALKEFLRQGGETFTALSERPGQLRGTIENSAEVFATTAERNEELAETFRIFPTFLRESRETLTRLEEFARDTDPVVRALYPAARELDPTLVEVQRLTPALNSLFGALGPVIPLAPKGFGAVQKLLGNDLPPLLEGFDPWLADFNSILQVLGMYKQDVTALLGNVAAASQGVLFEPNVGKSFHYLRSEAPLAPEAISTYPERLSLSRTNPYLKPDGLSQLTSGLKSFEIRQCNAAVNAILDPNTPADPAFNSRVGGDLEDAQAFFDRLQQYAFNDQLNTDAITPAPCSEQSAFQSVGVQPQETHYLHVREQP